MKKNLRSETTNVSNLTRSSMQTIKSERERGRDQLTNLMNTLFL